MVTRAKAAITKVKQAATPVVDVGEGGELGPFVTQESAPTLSEICLLRVECLRFLEDSVPLGVKEEALGRPIG